MTKKRLTKKINKPLYGAMLNVRGLYSAEAHLLHWDNYLKSYWLDETIDFSHLGFSTGTHTVYFCSINKKEVKAWILGIQAANYLRPVVDLPESIFPSRATK